MKTLEKIILSVALSSVAPLLFITGLTTIKTIEIVQRPYLSGGNFSREKNVYNLYRCEGEQFLPTKYKIPEEAIRVNTNLLDGKKLYVELKIGLLGVKEATFYNDNLVIPKTKALPRAGQSYYDGLCKD